jgi:hypothetical protein
MRTRCFRGWFFLISLARQLVMSPKASRDRASTKREIADLDLKAKLIVVPFRGLRDLRNHHCDLPPRTRGMDQHKPL